MKILIPILILAAILRFWDLPNNPPGLTWDEAALGYNSYSLLTTARDEYGILLPLNLKSFGDYKPALYAYLDIPFVAILGLDELVVRTPSFIAGVLIVLLVFLLTRQLFKDTRLSILAAFFVSVSPLAIQFSRPAFEANLALLLNLLAVYLFIKGGKLRILSAVIFILSLITYQSSRIFVSMLVLLLLVIYQKEVGLKKIALPISLFFGAFILILAFTFFGGQGSRLATLNFFAYQRSIEDIKVVSQEDGLDMASLSFQFLHGEWWAYTRGLFERYLLYFSPKMLALKGDYSLRHSVPDLGVMYYYSALLLPLGLVYFLRQNSLGVKLLFGWLLLAPIPAVLSRDLLNMVRALNLVVPLEILQAGGLLFLIDKFKSQKYLYIFLSAAALIFFVNFAVYLDRYFIHAPKENSQYWLYGYKQAIDVFKQRTRDKKYDNIVMTDYYGQPFIYYLFYSKYPPEKYQKQAKLEQKSVDVGTVKKIDNIEFRHIYWPADRGVKNSLYIGTLEELPDKDINPLEAVVLGEVNFLDGQNAFRIVETR